jgi:hypothetical protein
MTSLRPEIVGRVSRNLRQKTGVPENLRSLRGRAEVSYRLKGCRPESKLARFF